MGSKILDCEGRCAELLHGRYFDLSRGRACVCVQVCVCMYTAKILQGETTQKPTICSIDGRWLTDVNFSPIGRSNIFASNKSSASRRQFLQLSFLQYAKFGRPGGGGGTRKTGCLVLYGILQKRYFIRYGKQ